eukprot:729949-Pleurochrysis_carterae.AAC.1
MSTRTAPDAQTASARQMRTPPEGRATPGAATCAGVGVPPARRHSLTAVPRPASPASSSR